MKGNATRVVRFSAGLAGVLVVAWVLAGQAAGPVLEGLPTDWTHRHVIFSQPTTAEQFRRIAQDPRYWQQWYRQSLPREVSPDVESDWSNLRDRVDSPSSLHRDWSEDLGSTGSVGAGNFPAKYSFGITNANCASATKPDFVVFSTGLAGSGTQASIVAFDNLYSGCTGTVPTVYWAYNTGGQILTSPVFSGDGSQLAFVQTNGLTASLVLLRWTASTTETVGHPGAPTSLAPSSYFGCTAACMTTIALTSGGATPTGTNDTTSSVYYDYTGDTAWVGDGSGWLHRFTPVFLGTPAEIRTSPWPKQVNTAAPTALTSPVHDLASGNVFVGDKGGFLYSVSASAGTVAASAQVDHGVGLVAGPMLDSTSGFVYVFSSSDGTTNCPTPGNDPCSAVYQFATTFKGGATGTEVTVGTSSAAPNPLYDGAFDHAYLTSTSPPTGNLYVCGDTGVNPILYRVPITAGVFGTAASVAPLTAAGDHRACSPVTDLLNPNATGGGEERVFFSVTDNGHPTACAGAGCAMSFVNTPWQASTAYKVGQEILIYRSANGLHYINVAIVAGTTAGTAPAWPTAIGDVTTDGSIHWMNQGATEVTALPAWAAGHAYVLHDRIIDSGGNVEVVATAADAGTSGGTEPTDWATTAGLTTTDNTVTWTNAGFLPSAALETAGGTSGIIIDNTAASGGASQVYFSTLSPQACTTSGGTGGCAIQTSQSPVP